MVVEFLLRTFHPYIEMLSFQSEDSWERNDISGSPSDVALLRYVEMSASVEGIRQRYHVSLLNRPSTLLLTSN